MPRKPKTNIAKAKRDVNTRKLPGLPYPSLLANPSPQERLEKLLKLANEQGIRPIDDWEKFREEVGDFWPENETCDDFITWLRKIRREGREN